jgi:putative FmdB family regulatory protein
MPIYEYACDPCMTIYQTRHSMNGPRLEKCQACGGALRKVISAPNLNLKNYGGPTEAKYAKLSESDEIKKEAELQKVYKTIWVPEDVKHSPWDHDH